MTDETRFDPPIDVVIVDRFAYNGHPDVKRTLRVSDVAELATIMQLDDTTDLKADLDRALATGTPHATICPYSNEMDDVRILLVQDGYETLSMAHEMSQDGI